MLDSNSTVYVHILKYTIHTDQNYVPILLLYNVQCSVDKALFNLVLKCINLSGCMRQYYTPKLLPRPSPTLLTCAHKYCAVSQSTHVAFISTVLHPNWNRQQAAMHRHDQRAPSTDPGKGKFHIHHHFRVIILQGGEQLPSQVLCLACRTLACLVHQKFTKVIVQITAFSRLPPPH